VLTIDEAQRVASNIAKLPGLLGAAVNPELDRRRRLVGVGFGRPTRFGAQRSAT
jgi:hypothetical protein